jgi:hypothetical protein
MIVNVIQIVYLLVTLVITVLICVLNLKSTLGSPYAIKGLYSINPDFGSDIELTELIQQAHKLKIKVILNNVSIISCMATGD